MRQRKLGVGEKVQKEASMAKEKRLKSRKATSCQKKEDVSKRVNDKWRKVKI